MEKVNKENAIFNIVFTVAVLSIIAFFLNCSNVYAAHNDDWRAYLSGEDTNTFFEGWEGAGGSGNSAAYRYKHLDDNTILEEIYGTGAFYEMGIIPMYGEDLIIDIGDEFTSIGEEAFYPEYGTGVSKYLTKVIMPDTITKIDDRAFYNCKVLSSINMPASLTSIGEEAFYGCSDLQPITFPSKLQYIKESAFQGCVKFKSITTPASTKKVYDSAFYGCTGLTNVTFEGNNAVIGDCIGNCPNIETLTIGKGVKKCAEIENKFKKLKTISVNTNTSYTDKQLLYNKTTATKVIYTGTGTIKDLNFTWQPKLKTVVIKNGVKGIGRDGFVWFSKLEKLTIPASVKTINAEAITNCKKLKSLTIGSGTTKLGREMLFGCSRLKTITIKSKKLKKSTVKQCLSGSKVKTIKVKVGTAKQNKKYIKKYKKIFTAKNAGKKVTVK